MELRSEARTVKFAKDLQSEQTLEKLEIERRYWQIRNIDWGIVTEYEIPEVLARNVEWLHPFLHAENLSPLSEREIFRIATALTLRVAKGNVPLVNITDECDDQLGLSPGTGLSVVRHLIANRQWQTDKNRPLQPSKPLVLLAAPLVESYRTVGGAE